MFFRYQHQAQIINLTDFDSLAVAAFFEIIIRKKNVFSVAVFDLFEMILVLHV